MFAVLKSAPTTTTSLIIGKPPKLNCPPYTRALRILCCACRLQSWRLYPRLGQCPSSQSYPDVPNPLRANICGISGERHQIGRDYYDKLLATIPNLEKVYVLHKDNYPPSVKALAKIQTGSHPASVVPVPVGSPYGDADIRNAINGITGTASSALLVLPADSFFGSANNIIALAHAKSLPDFWPVTDWVRHSAAAASAVGGYGFPQRLVRGTSRRPDRIDLVEGRHAQPAIQEGRQHRGGLAWSAMLLPQVLMSRQGRVPVSDTFNLEAPLTQPGGVPGSTCWDNGLFAWLPHDGNDLIRLRPPRPGDATIAHIS